MAAAQTKTISINGKDAVFTVVPLQPRASLKLYRRLLTLGLPLFSAVGSGKISPGQLADSLGLLTDEDLDYIVQAVGQMSTATYDGKVVDQVVGAKFDTLFSGAPKAMLDYVVFAVGVNVSPFFQESGGPAGQ